MTSSYRRSLKAYGVKIQQKRKVRHKAAKVKIMKITTSNSITVNVVAFLRALEKKKWGDDNYIYLERITTPTDENRSRVHITGVELFAHAFDASWTGAEEVIRFKQIQFGVDAPKRIIYYANEMDDSVINHEDAYNILVDRIQSIFDEYVFEE